MPNYEFKAKAFKKMEDPTEGKGEHVKYVCYVQAKSVPLDFNDWMETNPREQKMKTNVAERIVDSLSNSSNFHELNRGILMSVEKVEYDNKTNTVTVELNDPSKHGNIDGGHTLRAILDAKINNSLSDDRYVFFEIFEGINSPVELAAARNTSVQVDLKSIEELNKSFEVIKYVFRNLPFDNRIAYKMNQHYNDPQDDTGHKTSVIDIRELIAIIAMFSQSIYPIKTTLGTLSEVQPVQSYTGKETSLRKYLSLKKENREKMILDMESVIPDIFKLWDTIERNFATVANKSNKRYGTKKYSKYAKDAIVDYSLFSEEGLQYSIPKGLLYPIVGSFRALIQIDSESGIYCWVKNPFEVWNAIGSKLVTIVLEERTVDNPEQVGKNSNLWSNLFKEVYIYGYSM